MARRRGIRRLTALLPRGVRGRAVLVAVLAFVAVQGARQVVAWWGGHGVAVLATLRWAGPLAGFALLVVGSLLLHHRLGIRRQRLDRLRALDARAGRVGGGRTPVRVGHNDGKDLERAVAALLEFEGCLDVQVGGGSGDRTLDVFGVHPLYGRVGVQCKDYTTSKVGSQKAQEIISMIWTDPEVDGRPANIDVAMVVTTNYFTPEALTVLTRPRLIERGDQVFRRPTLAVDRTALAAWRAGTWSPLPVPARQEAI